MTYDVVRFREEPLAVDRFRDADFRPVLLRAEVVRFRVAVRLAVDFLAVDFRAVDFFRVVDFLRVAFFP